jgi:putative flippase GtrA
VLPEQINRFVGHAAVQQVLRFAVVGVVATAVHYSILTALVEIGHVNKIVATTIGYTIGTIVSYALNRRFTFQARGTPVVASFAKYAVLYGIGAVLNAAIFGALVHAGLHYLLAQIAATGIVLFWNFLGARFVVFR